MFTRTFRAALATALVVVVAFGFVSVAQPIQAQAVCLGDIPAAVAWLTQFQNEDGGFTNGFAPESDLGTTADTVFAITVSDGDLSSVVKGDKTTLDYLTDQVGNGAADSAGKLGKILLALADTDADLTDFAGHNLIEETLAGAETLADGSDLFSLSLAVLGLAAVGAEVPETAIAALVDNQLADTHGWSFSAGGTADTNTTALAVQALIAVDAEFDKAGALEYFQAAQNEDGGFPYQKPSEFGTDSDANSTAQVIQALIALGESLEAWGNPEIALATFQQENGAFTYQLAQPADSILATVQAIPALCGTTLVSSDVEAEATAEVTQ